MELGDLADAERDLDLAIRMDDDDPWGYFHRSQLYQRQSFAWGKDRHPQALEDLRKFARFANAGDSAMYLNQIAYARALAGRDLEQGLTEVEEALQTLRGSKPRAMLASREERNRYQGSLSAYLDTRGYLRHLTGKHEEALDDLKEALAIMEEIRSQYTTEPRGEAAAELQALDHSRGVMFQHRGLVLEKLGRTEEAQQDFARAKELGFDPAAGVF
jgi:tetratricopeptide (TPR) repeat protein